MWFEPTNLVNVEDRQSGRCFVLGVPTELHKFWISQNLLDRICSEISALYQNRFQIELVVTGQADETSTDTLIPAINEPVMIQELESAGVVSGAFGGQRDML